MEQRAINTESILKQFELLQNSINRAALPFQTGMLQDKIVEVSLYELIKLREQALNMIREIDPRRFGIRETKSIEYPDPRVSDLYLCPYCGDPDCQSDHK